MADGRLRVHAFQLVDKNGTPGAFNISTSRGSQWTAGYVWPGSYVLELYDNATGRSAKVCADLVPGAPLAIDLAQDNFGGGRCPFS